MKRKSQQTKMRYFIKFTIFIILIYGCESKIEEEIDNEEEEIEITENTFNSYILYEDQFFQLKDTCIFECMLSPSRQQAFYMVINSPSSSSDTARVLLMCYGNICEELSPIGLIYSDHDDEAWNTFTNRSYISVNSYAINGHFLSNGKVAINQSIDEWEILMDGIYDSGDSVSFTFKGTIMSLDEYRDLQ